MTDVIAAIISSHAYKEPKWKRWRVSVEWMRPGESVPVSIERYHARLRTAIESYKSLVNDITASLSGQEADFRICVNLYEQPAWADPQFYYGQGIYNMNAQVQIKSEALWAVLRKTSASKAG